METMRRLFKRAQPLAPQLIAPQAIPLGHSPLESLPYDIRALIFGHLGYTHIYLPSRVATIRHDEIYYSFLSIQKQEAAFARRKGYKSRISTMEYKHGEIWPRTTTVTLPSQDRLVHVEGCGFDPILLWISRKMRVEVLTLLYYSTTAKFGYTLSSNNASWWMSFLSGPFSVGLSLDHFTFIRHIALTEDIDKDARNNTYPHKKLCRNPIRGLTLSLQFVAQHCPYLASLSIEPNHLALMRSRERFVLKLVAAVVNVVRSCKGVSKVKLGLRRSVLMHSRLRVERVKSIALELEGIEHVHRLHLVEDWASAELGYLTAIPPHIRFLPCEVEVWS